MLKLNQVLNDIEIYDVIENDEIIGSVEYLPKEDFIDNIYLLEEWRGKGLLRSILSYFPSATLLPLPQHVEKFKHLGYEISHINGTDIYYKPMVLPVLIQQ